MQVTYDQGFYPRSFTVKKGVPIELTVMTRFLLVVACRSWLFPNTK
jgi:hypothetical protein